MLGNDALDIVRTCLAEDDLQTLCACFALGGETVWVFAVDLIRFLAVPDEVDDRMGLGILALLSKETGIGR